MGFLNNLLPKGKATRPEASIGNEVDVTSSICNAGNAAITGTGPKILSQSPGRSRGLRLPGFARSPLRRTSTPESARNAQSVQEGTGANPEQVKQSRLSISSPILGFRNSFGMGKANRGAPPTGSANNPSSSSRGASNTEVSANTRGTGAPPPHTTPTGLKGNLGVSPFAQKPPIANGRNHTRPQQQQQLPDSRTSSKSSSVPSCANHHAQRAQDQRTQEVAKRRQVAVDRIRSPHRSPQSPLAKALGIVSSGNSKETGGVPQETKPTGIQPIPKLDIADSNSNGLNPDSFRESVNSLITVELRTSSSATTDEKVAVGNSVRQESGSKLPYNSDKCSSSDAHSSLGFGGQGLNDRMSSKPSTDRSESVEMGVRIAASGGDEGCVPDDESPTKVRNNLPSPISWSSFVRFSAIAPILISAIRGANRKFLCGFGEQSNVEVWSNSLAVELQRFGTIVQQQKALRTFAQVCGCTSLSTAVDKIVCDTEAEAVEKLLDHPYLFLECYRRPKSVTKFHKSQTNRSVNEKSRSGGRLVIGAVLAKKRNKSKGEFDSFEVRIGIAYESNFELVPDTKSTARESFFKNIVRNLPENVYSNPHALKTRLIQDWERAVANGASDNRLMQSSHGSSSPAGFPYESVHTNENPENPVSQSTSKASQQYVRVRGGLENENDVSQAPTGLSVGNRASTAEMVGNSEASASEMLPSEGPHEGLPSAVRTSVSRDVLDHSTLKNSQAGNNSVSLTQMGSSNNIFIGVSSQTMPPMVPGIVTESVSATSRTSDVALASEDSGKVVQDCLQAGFEIGNSDVEFDVIKLISNATCPKAEYYTHDPKNVRLTHPANRNKLLISAKIPSTVDFLSPQHANRNASADNASDCVASVGPGGKLVGKREIKPTKRRHSSVATGASNIMRTNLLRSPALNLPSNKNPQLANQVFKNLSQIGQNNTMQRHLGFLSPQIVLDGSRGGKGSASAQDGGKDSAHDASGTAPASGTVVPPTVPLSGPVTGAVSSKENEGNPKPNLPPRMVQPFSYTPVLPSRTLMNVPKFTGILPKDGESSSGEDGQKGKPAMMRSPSLIGRLPALNVAAPRIGFDGLVFQNDSRSGLFVPSTRPRQSPTDSNPSNGSASMSPISLTNSGGNHRLSRSGASANPLIVPARTKKASNNIYIVPSPANVRIVTTKSISKGSVDTVMQDELDERQNTSKPGSIVIPGPESATRSSPVRFSSVPTMHHADAPKPSEKEFNATAAKVVRDSATKLPQDGAQQMMRESAWSPFQGAEQAVEQMESSPKQTSAGKEDGSPIQQSVGKYDSIRMRQSAGKDDGSPLQQGKEYVRSHVRSNSQNGSQEISRERTQALEKINQRANMKDAGVRESAGMYEAHVTSPEEIVQKREETLERVDRISGSSGAPKRSSRREGISEMKSPGNEHIEQNNTSTRPSSPKRSPPAVKTRWPENASHFDQIDLLVAEILRRNSLMRTEKTLAMPDDEKTIEHELGLVLGEYVTERNSLGVAISDDVIASILKSYTAARMINKAMNTYFPDEDAAVTPAGGQSPAGPASLLDKLIDDIAQTYIMNCMSTSEPVDCMTLQILIRERIRQMAIEDILQQQSASALELVLKSSSPARSNGARSSGQSSTRAMDQMRLQSASGEVIQLHEMKQQSTSKRAEEDIVEIGFNMEIEVIDENALISFSENVSPRMSEGMHTGIQKDALGVTTEEDLMVTPPELEKIPMNPASSGAESAAVGGTKSDVEAGPPERRFQTASEVEQRPLVARHQSDDLIDLGSDEPPQFSNEYIQAALQNQDNQYIQSVAASGNTNKSPEFKGVMGKQATQSTLETAQNVEKAAIGNSNDPQAEGGLGDLTGGTTEEERPKEDYVEKQPWKEPPKISPKQVPVSSPNQAPVSSSKPGNDTRESSAPVAARSSPKGSPLRDIRASSDEEMNAEVKDVIASVDFIATSGKSSSAGNNRSPTNGQIYKDSPNSIHTVPDNRSPIPANQRDCEGDFYQDTPTHMLGVPRSPGQGNMFSASYQRPDLQQEEKPKIVKKKPKFSNAPDLPSPKEQERLLFFNPRHGMQRCITQDYTRRATSPDTPKYVGIPPPREIDHYSPRRTKIIRAGTSAYFEIVEAPPNVKHVEEKNPHNYRPGHSLKVTNQPRDTTYWTNELEKHKNSPPRDRAFYKASYGGGVRVFADDYNANAQQDRKSDLRSPKSTSQSAKQDCGQSPTAKDSSTTVVTTQDKPAYRDGQRTGTELMTNLFEDLAAPSTAGNSKVSDGITISPNPSKSTLKSAASRTELLSQQQDPGGQGRQQDENKSKTRHDEEGWNGVRPSHMAAVLRAAESLSPSSAARVKDLKRQKASLEKSLDHLRNYVGHQMTQGVRDLETTVSRLQFEKREAERQMETLIKNGIVPGGLPSYYQAIQDSKDTNTPMGKDSQQSRHKNNEAADSFHEAVSSQGISPSERSKKASSDGRKHGHEGRENASVASRHGSKSKHSKFQKSEAQIFRPEQGDEIDDIIAKYDVALPFLHIMKLRPQWYLVGDTIGKQTAKRVNITFRGDFLIAKLGSDIFSIEEFFEQFRLKEGDRPGSWHDDLDQMALQQNTVYEHKHYQNLSTFQNVGHHTNHHGHHYHDHGHHDHHDQHHSNHHNHKKRQSLKSAESHAEKMIAESEALMAQSGKSSKNRTGKKRSSTGNGFMTLSNHKNVLNAASDLSSQSISASVSPTNSSRSGKRRKSKRGSMASHKLGNVWAFERAPAAESAPYGNEPQHTQSNRHAPTGQAPTAFWPEQDMILRPASPLKDTLENSWAVEKDGAGHPKLHLVQGGEFHDAHSKEPSQMGSRMEKKIAAEHGKQAPHSRRVPDDQVLIDGQLQGTSLLSPMDYDGHLNTPLSTGVAAPPVSPEKGLLQKQNRGSLSTVGEKINEIEERSSQLPNHRSSRGIFPSNGQQNSAAKDPSSSGATEANSEKSVTAQNAGGQSPQKQEHGSESPDGRSPDGKSPKQYSRADQVRYSFLSAEQSFLSAEKLQGASLEGARLDGNVGTTTASDMVLEDDACAVKAESPVQQPPSPVINSSGLALQQPKDIQISMRSEKTAELPKYYQQASSVSGNGRTSAEKERVGVGAKINEFANSVRRYDPSATTLPSGSASVNHSRNNTPSLRISTNVAKTIGSRTMSGSSRSSSAHRGSAAGLDSSILSGSSQVAGSRYTEKKNRNRSSSTDQAMVFSLDPKLPGPANSIMMKKHGRSKGAPPPVSGSHDYSEGRHRSEAGRPRSGSLSKSQDRRLQIALGDSDPNALNTSNLNDSALNKPVLDTSEQAKISRSMDQLPASHYGPATSSFNVPATSSSNPPATGSLNNTIVKPSNKDIVSERWQEGTQNVAQGCPAQVPSDENGRTSYDVETRKKLEAQQQENAKLQSEVERLQRLVQTGQVTKNPPSARLDSRGEGIQQSGGEGIQQSREVKDIGIDSMLNNGPSGLQLVNYSEAAHRTGMPSTRQASTSKKFSKAEEQRMVHHLLYGDIVSANQNDAKRSLREIPRSANLTRSPSADLQGRTHSPNERIKAINKSNVLRKERASVAHRKSTRNSSGQQALGGNGNPNLMSSSSLGSQSHASRGFTDYRKSRTVNYGVQGEITREASSVAQSLRNFSAGESDIEKMSTNSMVDNSVGSVDRAMVDVPKKPNYLGASGANVGNVVTNSGSTIEPDVFMRGNDLRCSSFNDTRSFKPNSPGGSAAQSAVSSRTRAGNLNMYNASVNRLTGEPVLADPQGPTVTGDGSLVLGASAVSSGLMGSFVGNVNGTFVGNPTGGSIAPTQAQSIDMDHMISTSIHKARAHSSDEVEFKSTLTRAMTGAARNALIYHLDALPSNECPSPQEMQLQQKLGLQRQDDSRLHLLDNHDLYRAKTNLYSPNDDPETIFRDYTAAIKHRLEETAAIRDLSPKLAGYTPFEGQQFPRYQSGHLPGREITGALFPLEDITTHTGGTHPFSKKNYGGYVDYNLQWGVPSIDAFARAGPQSMNMNMLGYMEADRGTTQTTATNYVSHTATQNEERNAGRKDAEPVAAHTSKNQPTGYDRIQKVHQPLHAPAVSNGVSNGVSGNGVANGMPTSVPANRVPTWHTGPGIALGQSTTVAPGEGPGGRPSILSHVADGGSQFIAQVTGSSRSTSKDEQNANNVYQQMLNGKVRINSDMGNTNHVMGNTNVGATYQNYQAGTTNYVNAKRLSQQHLVNSNNGSSASGTAANPASSGTSDNGSRRSIIKNPNSPAMKSSNGQNRVSFGSVMARQQQPKLSSALSDVMERRRSQSPSQIQHQYTQAGVRATTQGLTNPGQSLRDFDRYVGVPEQVSLKSRPSAPNSVARTSLAGGLQQRNSAAVDYGSESMDLLMAYEQKEAGDRANSLGGTLSSTFGTISNGIGNHFRNPGTGNDFLQNSATLAASQQGGKRKSRSPSSISDSLAFSESVEGAVTRKGTQERGVKQSLKMATPAGMSKHNFDPLLGYR